MIALFIDTTDRKVAKVGLIIGKETKQIIQKRSKSQVVLAMILDILKENKLKLKDLDSVRVEIGPGSYTGLRVGVAIANTLGLVLNIPVNGKKAVEPIYK